MVQSNEFNYEWSISRSPTKVTSFLLANGFDFKLKTDFFFNETTAELRYQFFSPYMGMPQANLFVFYNPVYTIINYIALYYRFILVNLPLFRSFLVVSA